MEGEAKFLSIKGYEWRYFRAFVSGEGNDRDYTSQYRKVPQGSVLDAERGKIYLFANAFPIRTFWRWESWFLLNDT